MFSAALCDTIDLQNRLTWLTTRKLPPATTMQNADVIISHFEVNDRHGTGVLLRKIFAESPNLLCVRTYSYYDNENYLGQQSFALAHDGLSRPEVFANVLRAFKGMTVGRVVCVPFFQSEVWTAIALKELFDVPVCTYIMDDRNIHDPAIPDALLAELLHKSSVRLVISPEMQSAYTTKFGLSFGLLPPVVSRRLMPTEVQMPSETAFATREGILVGNIKSQRSLNLLRETIRGTGLTVHWYGDVEKSLQFTAEELQADGLHHCGFISQQELAARLSKYLYTILPTSPLRDDTSYEEETHTARAIARLSWPSRISFVMATSHTPLLVLGSRETTAARTVERLGIGVVADYEPAGFKSAVLRLCPKEAQRRMRARALELAPQFAAEGVADWIWQSMASREPCDQRFERLGKEAS